jgi:hypothetical protein
MVSFMAEIQSIEQYLSRMNRETSRTVGEQFRSSPPPQVSWWTMVVRTKAAFLRSYFLRGGVRRGVHGFVGSMLQAITALALTTKQWEYAHRLREQDSTLPPTSEDELDALS